MASLDLIDLLAGANENLGIEFKAWMNPKTPEAKAKLARHLAALANYGGGYLIFGVDDKTRKPLGPTDLDLDLSARTQSQTSSKNILSREFRSLSSIFNLQR